MAADSLSQDEIDALLNAISSGDSEDGSSSKKVDQKEEREKKLKRKIKIYDFKRPDKFSKEQMRTVNRIHETFARLVSTFFSTHLRSVAHLDIVSVDQITYEEFIRSVSNPTMLCVFHMGTLEGTGILELNLSVVYAVLDRLFGGVGKSLDKVRILTEIEEAVFKRVLVKLFDLLKESWFQVVELAPKLELIESNPQFTQIVAPAEMVLLVTFEIKIGEAEGILNLCFPYVVLEPVVNKLTTQSWFTPIRHESSSEDIISIEKKVKNIGIPVISELGETKSSFQEVMNLKIGDIIVLNQKASEPINIKIGNSVKYKGRPGVLGRFKGVVIEEVIQNDSEEVFKI